MKSEKQFDWEASPLIRLKERLQFTGWLQFVLPLVLALGCFFLSLLLYLLRLLFLADLLVGLGCFLLAILVFDLLTVKFQIHPRERLPKKPGDDNISAFDVMRLRQSCRSFQKRRLTADDRKDLLEFVQVQTLPSSRLGNRPIRFEYVVAPLTVWPAIVPNHEFLVAIAPQEYSRMAVIDVGRCLQKVVLHATRMGVATCWIGPGADQDSVISHLGPDRFNIEEDRVICVCAVGYKSVYAPLAIRLASSIVSNRRLPLTSLFYEDEHTLDPLDVTREPFKAYGQCFEACQFSPSSYNAQTTRCVAVTDEKEEEANVGCIRFDFYSTNPRSRCYAPVALGIWLADWDEGVNELGIEGYFVMLTEEERVQQRTVSGRGKECSRAAHAPLTSSSPMQYDISWVKGKTK